MISVSEALTEVLALVDILPTETVSLRRAAGRTLAGDAAALQDQPSFAASAMDGYALPRMDAVAGDAFRIVGEAAAGRPYAGLLASGEAVRIFTGAPVPEGTARVLIQEDAERDGDRLILRHDADPGPHIRPAAGDFAAGAILPGPRRLGSRDIALMAAMGFAQVTVRRRPEVAILMTGDELRTPGSALGPGQITASNGYGLAAMVEAAGGVAHLLPIARDTDASLARALSLGGGADVLVTVGGASVGDHDLVAGALRAAGVEMAFHKIAMRPGKPLMAGHRGPTAVLGLPGNPVSAMVCGTVFLLPMLARCLGLPTDAAIETRPLATPIEANGPRQHYMRAACLPDGTVLVADRQDSSLLRVLAMNDTLVVRPPGDPARGAGEFVYTMRLPD